MNLGPDQMEPKGQVAPHAVTTLTRRCRRCTSAPRVNYRDVVAGQGMYETDMKVDGGSSAEEASRKQLTVEYKTPEKAMM